MRLNVLHGSVGGITESDVLLASASNAIVIGFNVRPEPKAAALAEREGVDIRLYTIIYEALNDVRDALEGLLEPTRQEKVLGRAEVRQTFTVSGVGHGRRLLRHRRQDRARRPGAAAARQRRRARRAHRRASGASRTTCARWPSGYECGIALENYPGRQGRATSSRPTRSRRWPAGCRAGGAKGAQAAERPA